MVFKEDLILEFFNKIDRKIRDKKIIDRELKVKPIKEKVISIIGPRRAGKTYYLFQNKRKFGGLYIDFEGIEFSRIEPNEIFEIIPLYEKYFDREVKLVYLDEIQNLKDWQRVVRSLLNQGFKVFITGSSSKLLSKEIATQLRGRTLNYLLLPFSFREFLKAKKFKIKEVYSISEKESIKKYLKEYLEFGGFPEVVLEEEKEKILKEYFDLAFYKDFVERHKIESLEVAKIIFEYIIQNFSKEISISKIQNFIEKTLGVRTKTTIYNYLDKIQDTLFIFLVEKYDKSIYVRKRFPKKVYVCDTGLANIMKFSEDFGKLMENVVYLELLRGSNPFTQIYYFKDNKQREVDFLIKERDRIVKLINVTYANSWDEIDEREWRSLLKVYELFKKDKPELIIITWDYEDEKELSWFGKKGKIKFIPLWKWLLKIVY